MTDAKRQRSETGEAKLSQGAKVSRHVSREDESPTGRSETMSVGEAAKLLGLSVSSVQRLCEDYEANPDAKPTVGLPFVWTSASLRREDIHGRWMRGRRRLLRAGVLAHKRAREAEMQELTAKTTLTLAEWVARVARRAERAGVPMADLDDQLTVIAQRRQEAEETYRAVLATLRETEDRIRRAVAEQ